MKGNPEDAGTPIAALDAATNRNADSGTINNAQAATEKEHTMSLLEGIKQYPRAIGWSILFSTALVMEGYDVVLMGSFYAHPAFQRKYGDLQPDGSYELSAAWQSGLSNAMNAGQIIGLFINGIVADRYGYRRVMLASLFLTIGFIFILFFAPDKKTLVIGELMIGMPLGVFQTLSVTYASEVCPTVLRVSRIPSGVAHHTNPSLRPTLRPMSMHAGFWANSSLQRSCVLSSTVPISGRTAFPSRFNGSGQSPSLSELTSPQKVHGGSFVKGASKTLKRRFAVWLV